MSQLILLLSGVVIGGSLHSVWVNFGGDKSALVGVFVALLCIAYLRKKQDGQVNHCVDKSSPKVVNVCDIEDADKIVLCRCWKSKKFPYCDGAHVKHNEQTGDNVGPVIVKK
mmetsp:Transcript_14766/g.24023  ORF Transcript_14766/g.24023 Transcript_14766/m.24023 type:complete len:112 (-) Transcript_14766:2660-2995(-)